MRRSFAIVFAACFLFIFLASGFGTREAQAKDPYYQGKTVRIIVGFTPGGFYDRWSRHFARHMPRFIPGKPDMIVQNMPGAGSRTAANYLYNIAKPNGLIFGTINKNLYFDQITGNKLVSFDWRKYTWIGSPEGPPDVLYIRSDMNIKTLDDIKTAKKKPKCGSTGKANAGYVVPKVIEETMGFEFGMVLGYRGGRQIDLAVERGEVNCRGMTITPYLGREPFLTWHKNNFVHALLHTGKEPFPLAPEIPSIFDVAKKHNVSDEDMEFIDMIASASAFGRPFVGPPGIPEDRANILRKAFQSVLEDPTANAEAKKLNMQPDPADAKTLQAMALKVIDAPPKNLKRFKNLLGVKN